MLSLYLHGYSSAPKEVNKSLQDSMKEEQPYTSKLQIHILSEHQNLSTETILTQPTQNSRQDEGNSASVLIFHSADLHSLAKKNLLKFKGSSRIWC